MSQVTVMGLGAMGCALATALLDKGHPVTVWNRSPEKGRALVAAGAHQVDTPAAAIASGTVIIVCLLDDESVWEVLQPLGARLAGRVIVNLTNNTPAEARDLARTIEAQGARYIDGGIMAVPPMIGGRDVLIPSSGDEAAFREQAGLLGTFGANQYLGTDAGLASLHDLGLLAAMYGMFAGYLQAAALVRRGNVSAGAFNALAMPWLQAMIGVLPQLAEQIDSGDYTRNVVSNLGMQARAFANIIRASNELGVDPGLIEPLYRLMRKRVDAGNGAEDLAGLIDELPLPKQAA